jgi:hypothetical protein
MQGQIYKKVFKNASRRLQTENKRLKAMDTKRRLRMQFDKRKQSIQGKQYKKAKDANMQNLEEINIKKRKLKNMHAH